MLLHQEEELIFYCLNIDRNTLLLNTTAFSFDTEFINSDMLTILQASPMPAHLPSAQPTRPFSSHLNSRKTLMPLHSISNMPIPIVSRPNAAFQRLTP